MAKRIKMITVSQKENNAAAAIPAAPQDGQELLAARTICNELRRDLQGLLAHVANGARDLRDGKPWSRDLEQFESVSMEKTRVIARFPISTTDARFGALVHRARASFVAFRETVRREIIGVIGSNTDDDAYELALEKVTSRSALADESLKSVEHAIAQHWPDMSADRSMAQVGDYATS
jgi:hypothetical protein